MENHYTTNTELCETHHTVDKDLFKTKEAIADAVDLGLPIKCVWCGLLANEIPKSQTAIFGLPPHWYVRIGVNLSLQVYLAPSPRSR